MAVAGEGKRVLMLVPNHHEGRSRMEPLSPEAARREPWSVRAGLAAYQPERFWLKALAELGCRPAAVSTTAGVLVPDRLRLGWERLEEGRLGRISGLRRGVGNRLARLNPELAARNRLFLEAARGFRPDLVLITGGTGIVAPATMRRIRDELGAVCAVMHGSNPVGAAPRRELAGLEYADAVIMTDRSWIEDWRRLGAARVIQLPLSAFDPECHKPVPRASRRGIVFVGRLSPYRLRVLEALREFPLRFYGIRPPGVTIPARIRDLYRGEAWGSAMVEAVSGAELALNLHEPEVPTGANLRTFETAGIGTMQLVDRSVDAWFEPGREIAVFEDLARLRSLAAHYLDRAGERERIAAAARERALAEHTYAHRARALLTALFPGPG